MACHAHTKLAQTGLVCQNLLPKCEQVLALQSLDCQVTLSFLRILSNNGMRRLHLVCVSSCMIQIEMDSCRTKLSSVQFTGDSQMPLLPSQCLALMSYFNGCLMNHKNLTMLCSYFCSCLPFMVNLIITELLYRLCGVCGDAYIYAEKFTTFFFKQ